MNLHLHRFYRGSSATLGFIEGPDIYTLERPWMGNQPQISCIPPGVYDLEAHDGPKFRNTWALVGGTVSHYPASDTERSAILIHPANWVRQLRGCIAPGMAPVGLDSGTMILRSRRAMERLLRSLNPMETHALEITE